MVDSDSTEQDSRGKAHGPMNEWEVENTIFSDEEEKRMLFATLDSFL